MIKTEQNEVAVDIISSRIGKARRNFPPAKVKELKRAKVQWIPATALRPVTPATHVTTNLGKVRLAKCDGKRWKFVIPSGEQPAAKGEFVTHWLPKPPAAHDGRDYEQEEKTSEQD